MKIYKISTNAYDVFVTVDDENKVLRYLTSCDDVSIIDGDVRDVEDDTSWYDDCVGMDFGKFLGDAEIIDSADFI